MMASFLLHMRTDGCNVTCCILRTQLGVHLVGGAVSHDFSIGAIPRYHSSHMQYGEGATEKNSKCTISPQISPCSKPQRMAREGKREVVESGQESLPSVWLASVGVVNVTPSNLNSIYRLATKHMAVDHMMTSPAMVSVHSTPVLSDHLRSEREVATGFATPFYHRPTVTDTLHQFGML